MPSHQSAVSTLIREVLADPDLARRASSGVCSRPGRTGLVDAEAAAVIGAQRHERTPHRTNRRNGTRPKTVATTAGEVELAIPKLRTGSFFPSLLHPRRRVDKARMRRDLLRPESRGSPPARPGDLVRALGNESGISRSTVSRICKDIDEAVGAFLNRTLDHTWFPHLFAGRHPPGRESGAPGGLPGAGGGHRRVGRRPPRDPGTWPRGTPRRSTSGSSLSCGPCESGGSRSPPRRIPPGSCRPTGDAHAGIRAAVRAILPGAAWQRCRAPLRPQHHLQAGPGPPPSPRAPWSPRSSPRPVRRPSSPSTSTSSIP